MEGNSGGEELGVRSEMSISVKKTMIDRNKSDQGRMVIKRKRGSRGMKMERGT